MTLDLHDVAAPAGASRRRCRILPSAAILAGSILASAGCAGVPGTSLHSRGPSARLEEPAPEPPAPAEGTETAKPPEPSRTLFFAKGPLLYDPYIAAPRQSRTSVKLQMPVGRGRHPAFEATLGFDRSLVRWLSEDDPDRATEVQMEAAVFSRFDIHNQYDQDSSDYRFGFPVVFRDGDLAWKIHLYHLTSHLGDEFMVRTGRKPIHYHLEELAGGVSWDATEGSRLYGEAGTAVYAGPHTGNGRVQAGYEWVGKKWCSGLAPFFAVDLQARNDQSWNPGKDVAVGLAYGRSALLSLDFYHGRDMQTQFKDEQVRYLSLGITFDF